MNDHLSFSSKTLREFGLLVGSIIAGLFGAILPFLKGHSLPLWPWILGIVLIGLGLILPKSLAPIYKLWMRLGLILGWINSRIILSIIFFLVMTPMALIMKLINRDTLNRKLNFQQVTYRLPSRDRPITQMEKPY